MNAEHSALNKITAEKQSYFLKRCPAHLAVIRDYERLTSLLTNWNFIHHKVEALGPLALIADCDLLLKGSSPRVSESICLVQTLRDTLRLSAPALQESAHELPSQLLGRLQSSTDPAVQTFLRSMLEQQRGTWLRPLTPTLAQPRKALIRTMAGHTGLPTYIVLSADGHRAVSCEIAWRATLRVWEIETGVQSLTLSRNALSLAMSVDGRVAAWVAQRPTEETTDLEIWDVDLGREISRVSGRSPSFVAMNGDGTRIVFATNSNEQSICTTARGEVSVMLGGVVIWDAERQAELYSFAAHVNQVVSIAVSSNMERIITAAAGEEVKTWQWDGKEVTERHKVTAKISVDSRVSISRDGDIALIVSDEAVLLLNMSNGLIRDRLDRHMAAASLSADGLRAVVCQTQAGIEVWDVSSGREPWQLQPVSSGIVVVPALSADGRRLVCASSDQTIKVWEVN